MSTFTRHLSIALWLALVAAAGACTKGSSNGQPEDRTLPIMAYYALPG